MASLALGSVGALIGGVVGGPAGARLGFSVGALVGGALEARKTPPPNLGRLTDLRVTGSAYGTAIPQVWGSFRLGGNIIWAQDLAESSKRKGSKIAGTQTRVYSYTGSWAALVCRGPRSVRRIWGEDRVIYDLYAAPPSTFTIRAYRGDETQLPDSLIQAVVGATTPAYRGRCYVVFDTIPLADWGNRLPNLSFEIVPTYPDLILSHASNRVYYQFATASGKLADSGSKGYTLAESSPASTTVIGCFQALNGASGGGEGIQVPLSTSFLARTIGSDADLMSAQLTVEGWFQYKGDPVGSSPANKFQYLNPNTAEYSWKLTVQPNVFLAQINIQFQVFTNASGVTTVHNYAFTRDTLWHHVMATYNGAGNSVLYVDGVAVSTVTAPVTPLTITADAANVIQINGGDMRMDELAFYAGALTAADAANHSAAGVTGTIPSLYTTGSVMADLFAQAGLTPDQYDLTQAVDAVDGFVLTDRQDARTAVEALLQAYDTLLTEVDGKIVAVKRGAAPVLTLPAGDLAARVAQGSESDPPPAFTAMRTAEVELPFRTEVHYYSQYRNYLDSLQGATRYTKTWLQNPQDVRLPLVLSDDHARQIAEKLLYRAWLERESPQFSLPPHYSQLAAGDVVTLPVPGGTANVRLTQIDYALPGPLQCTAVLDDAAVLTQAASGGVMVTPAPEVTDVLTTTLVAWSGNALVNADATSVGLYAMAAGGGAGYWGGATLFWSRDGGVNYDVLDTLTDPATLGTALTALAAGTQTGQWDDLHTVDVSVPVGTGPTSTSDSAVLSGGNAAIVGDEVIQFGTVTVLTATTYRLSHLLRGLRGTDGRWGEHVVGERFGLLDTGQAHRIALDETLRGKPVLLKAVGSGQAIAAVNPTTLLITGDEYKTYAPCLASATRDGSQNITLVFVRRDRAAAGLRDGYDENLSESAESYDVEVLQNAPKTITGITNASSAVVTAAAHGFSVSQVVFITGVYGMTQINGMVATITAVGDVNHFTVNVDTSNFSPWASGGTADRDLRTITASTPSISYPASSQTADFGSPQSSVKFGIFQLGRYGRGYPLVVVL